MQSAAQTCANYIFPTSPLAANTTCSEAIEDCSFLVNLSSSSGQPRHAKQNPDLSCFTQMLRSRMTNWPVGMTVSDDSQLTMEGKESWTWMRSLLSSWTRWLQRTLHMIRNEVFGFQPSRMIVEHASHNNFNARSAPHLARLPFETYSGDFRPKSILQRTSSVLGTSTWEELIYKEPHRPSIAFLIHQLDSSFT